MSDLKIGDVVKIKDYHLIKEDRRAYYAKLANPSKHYIIEYITYVGEVYVRGENNYFRLESLEKSVMEDLLGREVNRGDIIVYGSGSHSGARTRWTETKLGIICNVIDGGKKYKILDDKKQPVLNPHDGLPIMLTTIAKVVFYPLLRHETSLSSSSNVFKNGKPKKVVSLSTTFLRLVPEELEGDWRQVYEEARKAYKI